MTVKELLEVCATDDATLHFYDEEHQINETVTERQLIDGQALHKWMVAEVDYFYPVDAGEIQITAVLSDEYKFEVLRRNVGFMLAALQSCIDIAGGNIKLILKERYNAVKQHVESIDDIESEGTTMILGITDMLVEVNKLRNEDAGAVNTFDMNAANVMTEIKRLMAQGR